MKPLQHYWTRNVLFGTVGIISFIPLIIKFGIEEIPWSSGGVGWLVGTGLIATVAILLVHLMFKFIFIAACSRCEGKMTLQLIDRKDHYVCQSCNHLLWTGSDLDGP